MTEQRETYRYYTYVRDTDHQLDGDAVLVNLHCDIGEEVTYFLFQTH